MELSSDDDADDYSLLQNPLASSSSDTVAQQQRPERSSDQGGRSKSSRNTATALQLVRYDTATCVGVAPVGPLMVEPGEDITFGRQKLRCTTHIAHKLISKMHCKIALSADGYGSDLDAFIFLLFSSPR